MNIWDKMLTFGIVCTYEVYLSLKRNSKFEQMFKCQAITLLPRHLQKSSRPKVYQKKVIFSESHNVRKSPRITVNENSKDRSNNIAKNSDV